MGSYSFTEKDNLKSDYYKAHRALVQQDILDIHPKQDVKKAIRDLANAIPRMTIKQAEESVTEIRRNLRSSILDRISELESKAESLGYDIFTGTVVGAEWVSDEDSKFYGES